MAKNLCVCCRGIYDTVSDTAFEQRIVGDEDFCGACWSEIMAGDADDINLPQLT